MAKKVEAPEVKEHAAFVADAAQEIFSLIMTATESAESMWQAVITLHLSGVTWDDLEGVSLKGADGKPIMTDADGVALTGKDGKPRALRLPDLPAYRTAKKRINNAKKHGMDLTDANGEPITSTMAAKAGKKKPAPTPEGEGEGEGESPSMPGAGTPVAFTDAVHAAKVVLGTLKTDAKLREGFRAEIAELARIVANDIASEKAAAEKAARDAAKAEAAAKARAAQQAAQQAALDATNKAKAEKAAAKAAREAKRLQSPKARKAAEKAAKDAAAKEAAVMYGAIEKLAA
jgi:hypothetical protein